MKKLNYFLAFIALSGLLFTSCEEENPLGPSLELTSDAAVETPANSIITLSWRANAGDANLKSFTIKEGNVPIVDEDLVDWDAYNIPASDNEAFVGSARVAIGNEGTTFTLTVTDNDGLTDSETVTVTIGGGSTSLSTPLDGTWQRIGGAAGTGLSAFGLQWTSNTATNAVITKSTATKLVKLNDNAWSTITTQEGLIEAVDAATDLAQYTGIGVTANASYSDVIATIQGDVYYMIKIDNATVSVGGGGTTITVSIRSVHKK